MDCSMPGFPASLCITSSRSLLKLVSIQSVMPSSHLILCCPLLLLPSIFSSIRVFSNELAKVLVSAPVYSKEYSGLISFKIDWFYFLEVQGTLKSLLQHRSSKASVLQRSAIFIVQLSHPYMTTGKRSSIWPESLFCWATQLGMWTKARCPGYLVSSPPGPSPVG